MNIDLMQDFNVFQGGFSTAMNMIRQVTGINEVMDASSPNPRQGFGVSKIAYDSAKNTLKPLMYGYELMYLSMLRSVNQLWLQVAEMGDPHKAFKSLGEGAGKIFDIASTLPERDFDVEIKILPSEEERQLLLQDLVTQKNQRQQTGQGGLTPDAYVMIYRIVKTGNLQLAQYKLAQAVERQRKIDAEENDRREQANTERLMASAQEANKAKEIEANAKSAQIQQKADLDLRNLIVSKLIEAGMNEQQALVNAEMSVAIAQGKQPIQAYRQIKPYLDAQKKEGMEEMNEGQQGEVVEEEEIVEEKM